MRHKNFYNQYPHKLLSQYYLFVNRITNKSSFKKYPVLKHSRHARLFNDRNKLKRFVYGNVKPKRDHRRL